MGNAKDGMLVPEMQDISRMLKKSNIWPNPYCIVIVSSDHTLSVDICFVRETFHRASVHLKWCQNKLDVVPSGVSVTDGFVGGGPRSTGGSPWCSRGGFDDGRETCAILNRGPDCPCRKRG